jgi:type VI secretion system secreted protein VgrG
MPAEPPSSSAIYELSTERYREGELQVVSFRGVEQISRPYSFEILLMGTSIDAALLERDLLGQPATLWMRASGDEAQPIHGIVRRVEAEGISGGGETRHRFRVWLAPRLWLLGRGRNSRIFQDKTVRDVIDAVLDEAGFDRTFRLMGAYAPRRYCVQHQESDLAFVRRLLAEEGILYAFEQPADQDHERVVFCDDARLLAPIAGSPELTFRDSGGMSELDADMRRFRLSRHVAPGSALLADFDFLRPSLDLHAAADSRGPEGGFDRPRLRRYDHHGEFEGSVVDDATAARHLEQHRARAAVAEGESRCRRLTPGRWFALSEDALSALDGRYTVLRVEHEGHHPELSGASAPTTDVYRNGFSCVPAEVTPRPRRPQRRIQQVMETAIVTGPAGQEIHTDEHGRIKVQFHWDREGKRNEHSSCWIRTMQAWAGTGWGPVHPAHRDGGDGRVSGRRHRPAHGDRRRLQRRAPASLPAAGEQDQERYPHAEFAGRRRVQRALVRGPQGARARLLARGARSGRGGEERAPRARRRGPDHRGRRQSDRARRQERLRHRRREQPPHRRR